MGRFYVDENTGRVHILPCVSRTHEECVQRALRKKIRKAQKKARRANRGRR
jgi:hypothetical protein